MDNFGKLEHEKISSGQLCEVSCSPSPGGTHLVVTDDPLVNEFEASAASIGYLMQIRYALYRAICLYLDGLDWQITIEASDDIEIVPTKGYRDLLQLKHRATNTSLTNSSPDLWKTLRVWVEGYQRGNVDLSSTSLFLITTSGAAPESLAKLLGADRNKRDEIQALATLNDVAMKSKNKANAKAYERWNSMMENEQIELLKRIEIVIQSSDIDGLSKLIENKLRAAARGSHMKVFVQNLEGWWLQRCINILRSSNMEYVSGEEFDSYLDELRESFLPNNLPIDRDITLLNPQLETYEAYRFVKQLNLIPVSSDRVMSAVRDYFRAYTQRLRWTRNQLIGPNELSDYEQRLFEEWKYKFDRLVDDAKGEGTEAAKSKAAREIYAWAEDAEAGHIRQACTERFIVRGSLHILADSEDGGIGWHPDFSLRLLSLLEPVKR